MLVPDGFFSSPSIFLNCFSCILVKSGALRANFTNRGMLVPDGFFSVAGLFFTADAEGVALLAAEIFLELGNGVGLTTVLGVPTFFMAGVAFEIELATFRSLSLCFTLDLGVAALSTDLTLDFGVRTCLASELTFGVKVLGLPLIFFDAEETPFSRSLGLALPRDLGVDLRPAECLLGMAREAGPGLATAGLGEFLVSFSSTLEVPMESLVDRLLFGVSSISNFLSRMLVSVSTSKVELKTSVVSSTISSCCGAVDELITFSSSSSLIHSSADFCSAAISSALGRLALTPAVLASFCRSR